MKIDVQLPDHKRITHAFALAPKKTIQELNKAVRAGLGEILKRETDQYFQFKAPRSKRTGMLQRMFHMHTASGMQVLAMNKTALRTEVHSTVMYADFVAAKNDFYRRILSASTTDVDKHFKKAVQNVLHSLK